MKLGLLEVDPVRLVYFLRHLGVLIVRLCVFLKVESELDYWGSDVLAHRVFGLKLLRGRIDEHLLRLSHV